MAPKSEKDKEKATVEALAAWFEIEFGPILAEINERLTRLEEFFDRSEARQRHLEAARLAPQRLASVEAKLSAHQGCPQLTPPC